VEVLKPERSLARHPLFQVMLVLQNNEEAKVSMPGLAMTGLPVDLHIAKFDLVFTFVPNSRKDRAPSDLDLYIGYASDLFDQSTVETLGERLVRLLRAVAERPTQLIGDIELLTDGERRQILGEWNETASRSQIRRCWRCLRPTPPRTHQPRLSGRRHPPSYKLWDALVSASGTIYGGLTLRV
jgi:non-ribosomal peptide synthetase component F